MQTTTATQDSAAPGGFPIPGLLPSSSRAAETQDWIDPLVDRIITAEQEFLAAMRRHRPMIEAYLQETGNGHAGNEPAGGDHYVLGRLGLREGVEFEPFLLSEQFRPGHGAVGSPVTQPSRLRFRRKGKPVFRPQGFARMVAPDVHDFNRKTYSFEFVRRELLGTVRCLVLDVAPREKNAAGRFLGRLWVEDEHGCLVRFNGTYVSSDPAVTFFHFDSWRFQNATRLWLPAFVYIEDRNQLSGNEARRIVGQILMWGYNGLENTKTSGSAEIVVDGGGPVEDASSAPDIGPLECQRHWRRQAESNLIGRLEKGRLLAAEGEVEKTLDTVVHNLLTANDLTLDMRCRVLLTTPLETFSIGQTIIISRGLLDVLPDEASLAMVLSDELAHVVLGHPIDRMFAFADLTMFPDREIPLRLRFQRSEIEMEVAHQKALDLLTHSPYADKMANAGLFLKTLRRRAPQLPNLIRANLGNQLASEDDLVRLGELAKKTPELKTARGEQVAALPLGARLKLDPWTNRIRMLEGNPMSPRDAGDETHFAVSPMMAHLARTPRAPVPDPEPEAKAKALTAAES